MKAKKTQWNRHNNYHVPAMTEKLTTTQKQNKNGESMIPTVCLPLPPSTLYSNPNINEPLSYTELINHVEELILQEKNKENISPQICSCNFNCLKGNWYFCKFEFPSAFSNHIFSLKLKCLIFSSRYHVKIELTWSFIFLKTKIKINNLFTFQNVHIKA